MADSHQNPTAAKLIAGAALAGLAYYASGLVVGLLPEALNIGWMKEVNAAIGFLAGWMWTGRKPGSSYVEGMSSGLTGVAITIFWGLLVNSSALMLDRALARRYDGPMEAVLAVFELMVEFGALLLDRQFALTMIVGGFVIGTVVHAVSKKFS